MERTFVMGDPHVRYEECKKLLQQVGFCDTDRLYVLGDMIDRGCGSVQMLSFCRLKKNVLKYFFKILRMTAKIHPCLTLGAGLSSGFKFKFCLNATPFYNSGLKQGINCSLKRFVRCLRSISSFFCLSAISPVRIYTSSSA